MLEVNAARRRPRQLVAAGENPLDRSFLTIRWAHQHLVADHQGVLLGAPSLLEAPRQGADQGLLSHAHRVEAALRADHQALQEAILGQFDSSTVILFTQAVILLAAIRLPSPDLYTLYHAMHLYDSTSLSPMAGAGGCCRMRSVGKELPHESSGGEIGAGRGLSGF